MVDPEMRYNVSVKYNSRDLPFHLRPEQDGYYPNFKNQFRSPPIEDTISNPENSDHQAERCGVTKVFRQR